MIRGTTHFKCPNCGKLFRGPDIEDKATVATMPLPCPCCGTRSPKANALDFVLKRPGRG